MTRLPALDTYRSLPGYRETGGYARRSWMESYAVDCPDCDGVERCICDDPLGPWPEDVLREFGK